VAGDRREPLRVEGIIQGRLELTAPWGARFANAGHAAFYLITRGGGWLQADGTASAVHVTKGSFVFVAKGQGYTIRDSPSTPVVPALQQFAAVSEPPDGVVRGGGGGKLTAGIFGCFAYDDDDPLVAALPALLHLPRGGDPALEWMDASLRLMVASSRRAGDAAFVNRLAEALLLQVLRAHLAQGNGQRWIGGFVDPRIARALRLVHERPAERWTLASLASSAGMSRTAFATRFAALVGEPPLKYVARWRMRKAARMLRATDHGLAEIAWRVGYEAEEAFIRAFKRFAGVPPGAYRKSAVR
jgi:AraC-like DNA-binding protein